MKGKLIIGVDATSWQNLRGYGRYTRALLRALVELDRTNQYIFFVDSTRDLAALPPGVTVRTILTAAPTSVAASAQGRRSLRDMVRMSAALSTAGCDVIIFPTVYSFVPVWSKARKVVVIHDVIAETYPQLTLPRLAARLFWRLKVALGRWQADDIVTVSDFSRDGLLRHFNIPKHRVHVVSEASAPVFRPLYRASITPQDTPKLAKWGLPAKGRWVVYVGGFAPHKNLLNLVQSFASLATRMGSEDLHLVMVGEYRREIFHSYYHEIKQLVDDLGIQNRVTFTGYLPDNELVVLLNQAAVLVLPSLMEGFGLPAVEAAACGCPVIATRNSPLPELLGEGGRYINPEQPAELTEALRDVLESGQLRKVMARAALESSQRLSWEISARRMQKLINQAAPG